MRRALPCVGRQSKAFASRHATRVRAHTPRGRFKIRQMMRSRACTSMVLSQRANLRRTDPHSLTTHLDEVLAESTAKSDLGRPIECMNARLSQARRIILTHHLGQLCTHMSQHNINADYLPMQRRCTMQELEQVGGDMHGQHCRAKKPSDKTDGKTTERRTPAHAYICIHMCRCAYSSQPAPICCSRSSQAASVFAHPRSTSGPAARHMRVSLYRARHRTTNHNFLHAPLHQQMRVHGQQVACIVHKAATGPIPASRAPLSLSPRCKM